MTIKASTNRIRNGTFDLCLQMLDRANDLKDAKVLIAGLQEHLNNTAEEYNERVVAAKKVKRG